MSVQDDQDRARTVTAVNESDGAKTTGGTLDSSEVNSLQFQALEPT